MRVKFLLGLVIVSAAAYACGGDTPGLGIISDGGGDDDDASSTHDASVRDSGIHDASVSDGNIGADSGHDAGIVTTDAGHDSGVVTHPHRDGGVVPAMCGTDSDAAVITCDPDSPTCCGTQNDGITVFESSFACTETLAACTGANTVPVQCRDDLDCPANKVCCGTFGADNLYQSVKCEDSCPEIDDAGAPTEFLRLCTPGVTDSECTDQGTTCTPSVLLPGFNHC